MCGIAGIIGQWQGADLTAFRDQAYSLLSCRGPDGRGALVASNGALVDCNDGPIPSAAESLLVHLRLSVLDLTASGAQPMVDATRRGAISFNGEVYNYETLRDMLGLRASELRGHSDTEVVLRWLGDGGHPSRFIGMFALVHLDAHARQATLLRDAFGIKPLFTARRGSAVAFSSDIRLLLALPGVSRGVDPVRVVEMLRYGAVTTDSARTAFGSIATLSPGERLVVPWDGSPSTLDKWAMSSLPARFVGDFPQAVRDVREAFIESVRLHLKSDVRVGCALSGGIDSSAIACVMRLLLGATGKIHAVSHVASEASVSEERWIDLAGAASGAVVHKVRSSSDELVADLDDLILAQGEPIGGTSLHAQFSVFRRAKAEGLTVMLDGQGADELLAGYGHYRAHYLWDLVRSGRLVAARRFLASPGTAQHIGARNVLMMATRQLISVRISDVVGEWVGRPALPAWVRVPTGNEYYTEQENRRRRQGLGLAVSLSDSATTSLQGLLRYEDRNSMRFSIESRVPFLSRDLVALLRSLPMDFLYGPHGESKYVFREAMRGIVPDAILARQDKIGFENDERAMLLNASGWAENVVVGSRGRSALIDGDALSDAWNRFQLGDGAAHSRRLWASLLYLRWHQLIGAEG